MITTPAFYKPSGKVPLQALIFMLLTGAFSIAIFSVIYTYASNYIPYIFAKFILVLLFGLTIGYFIDLGGRIGKVRNTNFTIGMSAILGLLAVYASWVVYIYISTPDSSLVLSPQSMSATIHALSEESSISVYRNANDWNPAHKYEGKELFVVWGLEALIVIVSAVVCSVYISGRRIFCENCNIWAEGKQSVEPLEYTGDIGELVSKVASNDLEELERLKLNVKLFEYLRLSLNRCDHCDKTNYLSLVFVQKPDDPEEQNNKETTLISNLEIPKESFSALSKKWAL